MMAGNRSLRIREQIGWQAEAPAPQTRKPLRSNVGQTLSSVNLGGRREHKFFALVREVI
jgi:hypothetical protein